MLTKSVRSIYNSYMATDLSYIDFVTEQLQGLGEVRYRKMFGEYTVYVDDKPIVLVCDNTCFVKKKEELCSLLQETGFPYDGAKEHFVLDIEDRENLQSVITVLKEITPLPKKKR